MTQEEWIESTKSVLGIVSAVLALPEELLSPDHGTLLSDMCSSHLSEEPSEDDTSDLPIDDFADQGSFISQSEAQDPDEVVQQLEQRQTLGEEKPIYTNANTPHMQKAIAKSVDGTKIVLRDAHGGYRLCECDGPNFTFMAYGTNDQYKDWLKEYELKET